MRKQLLKILELQKGVSDDRSFKIDNEKKLDMILHEIESRLPPERKVVTVSRPPVGATPEMMHEIKIDNMKNRAYNEYRDQVLKLLK